ncbi:MAG: vWA domain-containing protein [Planctomycetota bacterium]
MRIRNQQSSVQHTLTDKAPTRRQRIARRTLFGAALVALTYNPLGLQAQEPEAKEARPPEWVAFEVVRPADEPKKASQSAAEDKKVATDAAVGTRKKIEVCFVLDTTGSMSGLIQGAKDKIWSIANEMLEAEEVPEIKFSLIGYRDRGDDYITKITTLTSDLDQVYTELTAFHADGGNDRPESVNQALFEAVNKIKWSEDAETLKIVFLVGDAPPHMDYDDDIQHPETCKQAVDSGIIINTIQCGNDQTTSGIWNQIAKAGKGEYAAIEQSGGTQQISTPCDKEIARYNTELNRTVCGYGNATVQTNLLSKLSCNEESKAESIADRAGYFWTQRNLMGGVAACNQVVSGNNDLVEMLMDGKIELGDIDESKLPDSFKELDAEQREAKLTQMIQDRKTTMAKLDELIAKRRTFIAEAKKELPQDSFDAEIKTIIRDQADSKGIRYR